MPQRDATTMTRLSFLSRARLLSIFKHSLNFDAGACGGMTFTQSLRHAASGARRRDRTTGRRKANIARKRRNRRAHAAALLPASISFRSLVERGAPFLYRSSSHLNMFLPDGSKLERKELREEREWRPRFLNSSSSSSRRARESRKSEVGKRRNFSTSTSLFPFLLHFRKRKTGLGIFYLFIENRKRGKRAVDRMLSVTGSYGHRSLSFIFESLRCSGVSADLAAGKRVESFPLFCFGPPFFFHKKLLRLFLFRRPLPPSLRPSFLPFSPLFHTLMSGCPSTVEGVGLLIRRAKAHAGTNPAPLKKKQNEINKKKTEEVKRRGRGFFWMV